MIYRAKPIFTSPSKRYEKDFDGLIISGGTDINPSLYGGKKREDISYDDKRDILEMNLLEKAVKKEIPIFGICRGMQLINLFFGGSLHSDVFELDLNYPHPKTPFPLKDIFIKRDTNLYNIIKKEKIKANALHHQAIDKLGNGLNISAYDRNKICQAIEHNSKHFILGVQWHPEFIPFSKASHKIFYSFVKNVKFYKYYSDN